jgi:hypothetical protein
LLCHAYGTASVSSGGFFQKPLQPGFNKSRQVARIKRARDEYEIIAGQYI